MRPGATRATCSIFCQRDRMWVYSCVHLCGTENSGAEVQLDAIFRHHENVNQPSLLRSLSAADNTEAFMPPNTHKPQFFPLFHIRPLSFLLSLSSSSLIINAWHISAPTSMEWNCNVVTVRCNALICMSRVFCAQHMHLRDEIHVPASG